MGDNEGQSPWWECPICGARLKGRRGYDIHIGLKVCKKKPCSVEGCEKLAVSNGMCWNHYQNNYFKMKRRAEKEISKLLVENTRVNPRTVKKS
jgi:hypothetical protein